MKGWEDSFFRTEKKRWEEGFFRTEMKGWEEVSLEQK
jgi:hypothetical protein